MQTKTEEKKQLYEVLIIKHDQNHIVAEQTDKYDSAFEKWDYLTKIWTEALKDKVPFILKDPIVTAFDPGLIKEISIKPIMEVPESKYENPYHKKMVREGFSAMKQGNFVNPDLLDEGYR